MLINSLRQVAAQVELFLELLQGQGFGESHVRIKFLLPFLTKMEQIMVQQ
jgi:hypothetical protein